MSSSQVFASPPPMPRRISARNTRLQLPTRPEEPPIPPRLIGSPLLDKINSNPSPSIQPRALWIDGNEFGMSSSTPTASPVLDKPKRSARQAPPPEPRYTSPPPPLPPYPSSRHSTHGKSAHLSDLLPSSQSPRQIVT
ncbi:hypothetical protein BDY19DRAFT_990410 [Irpex rosettiformis]|uniref:Uncharacterized protein n=1 Tax=Irpex rosettiformis TaxID=378272 RepID=A0ACB8UEG7_9APHY|nr:hypothetical protein BDY19DRAFT_990410 [Irpex rosettiformis]